MIKSICVFCGSSIGNNPLYADAAEKLGILLAENNITLVYGGGNIGLMGIIADAALKNGGKVIGVMPGHLAEHEIAHTGLTEFYVTDNMMDRKKKLIEISDAFISMPGGFGTLDESAEVLTWNQLHLIHKPFGLLNIDGYFDGLLQFVNRGVQDSLIREEHKKSIFVDDNPEKLVNKLGFFAPVEMEKWISDIKAADSENHKTFLTNVKNRSKE
ncbi:MAG: TIGR00730 family Rossman fold protein [Bacteroidota bacterium]|nr:TIGR00730 family Rossman fold protein [Bacteroidota bacterium]